MEANFFIHRWRKICKIHGHSDIQIKWLRTLQWLCLISRLFFCVQAAYGTVPQEQKWNLKHTNKNERQNRIWAKSYLHKHNVLHIFLLWQRFSSYLSDLAICVDRNEAQGPSRVANKTRLPSRGVQLIIGGAFILRALEPIRWHYCDGTNNSHLFWTYVCPLFNFF